MTPSTIRAVFLAGSLLAAGLVGGGCTDGSGNGNGNPGAGGSSGGSGGTTGAGGSGGSGGGGGSGGTTPGFMSIAPCQNQSDYVVGTTVTFPVSATDFNYAPKCLIVSLPATGGTGGQDVTFNGDFVTHPLEPSALRGALTGNPITSTGAGTSKTFQFSTPGFFAYFCRTHNPSDNGAAMSGVVWVTQQILLPLTP